MFDLIIEIIQPLILSLWTFFLAPVFFFYSLTHRFVLSFILYLALYSGLITIDGYRAFKNQGGLMPPKQWREYRYETNCFWINRDGVVRRLCA